MSLTQHPAQRGSLGGQNTHRGVRWPGRASCCPPLLQGEEQHGPRCLGLRPGSCGPSCPASLPLPPMSGLPGTEPDLFLCVGARRAGATPSSLGAWEGGRRAGAAAQSSILAPAQTPSGAAVLAVQLETVTVPGTVLVLDTHFVPFSVVSLRTLPGWQAGRPCGLGAGWGRLRRSPTPPHQPQDEDRSRVAKETMAGAPFWRPLKCGSYALSGRMAACCPPTCLLRRLSSGQLHFSELSCKKDTLV